MGGRPSFALRLVLLWIAWWEPLAPASRRATWRDQWRGDLWHYHSYLARTGKPPFGASIALVARATGAVPHAFLLRAADWSPSMLLHDLTSAWRSAIRTPAFTAVAVLILALGIGANATIFSWIESVLLQPLRGVEAQHRLVTLRGTTPNRNDLSFSYLNFQDVRAARPNGLEDIAAARPLALNVRIEQQPMRIWGELVSANLFEVLRVRPALGRTLVPADTSAPGKEPVVVLSHAFWRRAFNADPAVVDRTIVLNNHPFTVVGVAAEGFQGSTAGLALDVFIPITMINTAMGGDRLPQRGSSFLSVIVRLSPGATPEQAQASLDVIAQRLAREHAINKDRGIRVVPLWRDGASGLLLPAMATLMVVVGVVLLIACANLAGLLLARASGRQRELAVRQALGAGRGRLVRQLLIENLLLAAAGGTAGAVLTIWTSKTIALFVPRTPFPVDFTATISPTVLLFVVVVTLATAIISGALPAWRATRPDVASALRDAAVNVIAGRRGWMRQSLVIGQVALSVLLLVCASLFVRSLLLAQFAETGFTMRQGVLASIDVLPNGYDQARGVAFFQQLLDRLKAQPLVKSAALSSAVPLDISSGTNSIVRVEGYQLRPGEEVDAYYNCVSPDYFATLGVPIVRGRAIDSRDVDGKPLVVVINETMARRYWPGRDALGGRIDFGNGPAVVVGIARDGKYSRLTEAPRNYMYLPIYQVFRPNPVLQVRTDAAPETLMPVLQNAVKALDANLPLFDVRTMEEHLQMSMFVPKLAGTLLALFGGLALLLSTVGLYSVIAFSVAQRVREIGVRVALGASSGEIVRMVVRQGVSMTIVGLAIGLVLASGAARLVGSQLIGVTPGDPISFGGTAVLLLIIGLAACAIPALRAARLDPVRALRRD